MFDHADSQLSSNCLCFAHIFVRAGSYKAAVGCRFSDYVLVAAGFIYLPVYRKEFAVLLGSRRLQKQRECLFHDLETPFTSRPTCISLCSTEIKVEIHRLQGSQ